MLKVENNESKNLISTNPAQNYDILGEVQVSTSGDIIEKVLSARTAQLNWQEIGLEKRIDYLQNLANILKDNREELIRIPMQETGVPLGLATGLADSAEEIFAWNIANSSKALAPEITYEDDNEVNEIIYEPYGVIGCIVAWNFLYPNFIQSATQPLLAGNTVVIKYSEEAPLFSKYLETLINQSGLPEGVVSFVYGDGQVGAELADADIDFIHFTGSYATGQKLYKKAAEKFIPIVNELGGSSPGVVFKDANIDEIIEDIFWSRFLNTAQFCDGLKRLIVHHSIFDELVEKLSVYTISKIVGNPFDKDTELGPLIAERQVIKLEEQLKDALDKGAKLICGGKRPDNLQGAYFEPSLLTNITSDMQVWHDEVFGPILPIVSFKTYEEAMELANDTIYGLSAYIYTDDKDLAQKAIKDLNAGTITVFGTSTYRPQSPFGGYKKSGMGRTGGIQGFHDSVQIKTVGRKK